MLFMVIEHFRGGDPAPVYRRFQERGRLAPEGLRYVSSWVDAGLGRCWQVMEADDRALLDQWIANWADLVEFEVHDVLTSAQASARVLGPPQAHVPAGSRVRVATPADADAIARHRVGLFAGELPRERHGELPAVHAASLVALRELLADGSTLAWVTGEPEPAGSLVMHLVRRLPSPTSPTGREGYVVHLYVDEEHRGTGLGAALLAAAEQAGRARGLSRIRLHSTARALPLYERAGYRMRANDLELPLG